MGLQQHQAQLEVGTFDDLLYFFFICVIYVTYCLYTLAFSSSTYVCLFRYVLEVNLPDKINFSYPQLVASFTFLERFEEVPGNIRLQSGIRQYV